jgi:hypothetical protein
MDFETFKKEKMTDIMDQFLDLDILDGYKEEYGIRAQKEHPENDVESYEDVYRSLGYAFLIFGRSIAKTISDVRLYEVLPPPLKRISVKDRNALTDGAWYWVCTNTLPPTPMRYAAATETMAIAPTYVDGPRINLDSFNDKTIFFGPIPVPENLPCGAEKTA